MKTKQIGAGLFLLSNIADVISLASAITFIYFLQQRLVKKVNTNSVNNWIKLSFAVAVITFAVAITSMLCVNILIEKERMDSERERGLKPEKAYVFFDCVMTLNCFCCCFGGPFSVDRKHDYGEDDIEDYVDLCSLSLCSLVCLTGYVGYLVYAFRTFKKLFDIETISNGATRALQWHTIPPSSVEEVPPVVEQPQYTIPPSSVEEVPPVVEQPQYTIPPSSVEEVPPVVEQPQRARGRN